MDDGAERRVARSRVPQRRREDLQHDVPRPAGRPGALAVVSGDEEGGLRAGAAEAAEGNVARRERTNRDHRRRREDLALVRPADHMGLKVAREAAIFAFFLALAIALTWPLAANLEHTLSDPGDPLLNSFILDLGPAPTLCLAHHRHHPSHSPVYGCG